MQYISFLNKTIRKWIALVFVLQDKNYQVLWNLQWKPALTHSKFQRLSDQYLADTSINDPSNNNPSLWNNLEMVPKTGVLCRTLHILTPGATSWGEFFFTAHSTFSLVTCASSIAAVRMKLVKILGWRENPHYDRSSLCLTTLLLSSASIAWLWRGAILPGCCDALVGP